VPTQRDPVFLDNQLPAGELSGSTFGLDVWTWQLSHLGHMVSMFRFGFGCRQDALNDLGELAASIREWLRNEVDGTES
jgi:hypothetical protein